MGKKISRNLKKEENNLEIMKILQKFLKCKMLKALKDLNFLNLFTLVF